VNPAIPRIIAHVLAGTACFQLLSVPVFAQPADPLDTALVAKHPTVYVTDIDGTESVGRLQRVDRSWITIETSTGEKSIERQQVFAIHRRGDSLANGAIAGALVGAGLAAWILADDGCGPMLSSRYERCSVWEFAAGMGMVGGIGAGIGLGIDAIFRGRTQIYPGKAGETWSGVRIAPTITHRYASISVSARW
jgi:hypothetical protein